MATSEFYDRCECVQGIRCPNCGNVQPLTGKRIQHTFRKEDVVVRRRKCSTCTVVFYTEERPVRYGGRDLRDGS